MQSFVVTTLFFIVNVGGYAIGGDDDITKAVHNYYPPPLNKNTEPKISSTTMIPSKDVITFPKGDSIFNSPPITEDSSPHNMKSSKMTNESQYNKVLDPRVTEFFKELLSNMTQMQTNKTITNSKNENNTRIHLDPKVLESIFNTSLPEVQQLMANSTVNGTEPNFDMDIRFLTESLLKGAFHNSIEEDGVKLRSVLIPPDQSPALGRGIPIDLAQERPTNLAGRLYSYVTSSIVLLICMGFLF